MIFQQNSLEVCSDFLNVALYLQFLLILHSVQCAASMHWTDFIVYESARAECRRLAARLCSQRWPAAAVWSLQSVGWFCSTAARLWARPGHPHLTSLRSSLNPSPSPHPHCDVWSPLNNWLLSTQASLICFIPFYKISEIKLKMWYFNTWTWYMSHVTDIILKWNAAAIVCSSSWFVLLSTKIIWSCYSMEFVTVEIVVSMQQWHTIL